jgi:hypothetical protein
MLKSAAAGLYHPFQPMVAVFTLPLAGGISARRLTHARGRAFKLDECRRHRRPFAQPRMPQSEWTARRRYRDKTVRIAPSGVVLPASC